MFLDCPAYLDHERTVRCGLPAEVRYRFTMRSTDGPLESAMIRCPAGHCFSGPIESLTWHGKDKRDPGSAAVTPRAGRDSVQGSHDGRDGVGWTAVRDFPAEPELEISRPNTAPAYYLGHPARLWITVMRPRHRRTTSGHSLRRPAGPGEHLPRYPAPGSRRHQKVKHAITPIRARPRRPCSRLGRRSYRRFTCVMQLLRRRRSVTCGRRHCAAPVGGGHPPVRPPGDRWFCRTVVICLPGSGPLPRTP